MPMRLLKAALAALVILAIFVAGVIVGGHPQATGLNQLRDPLRGLFLGDSGRDLSSQVLEVLRREYYADFDDQALQESSVDGLLEELDDPYTRYLTPDELTALSFHNDGAYVGVGIQVAARDGGVVITRVYPDSPAARAGIRAGDRIVAVDGTPVGDAALETVSGRIRGPEGSEVTITVRTEREAPRELTVKRSRVRIPPVQSRLLRRQGTTIGYLKLERFTRGAGDALREHTQRRLAAGAEALVLDLRQDPGGLVNEAVAAAAVFLPQGSAVVTTEGRRSPRRTLRTSSAPSDEGVPLVVLVDRNSASSAEIVAGALRDGDRARLVGETTFGKALVQSTWLLRDGGALRLTTARYLTPAGFDLAERGLTPEVRAVDDPKTPRVDEALEAAVADVLKPAAPAPPATPAPATP